MGVKNGLPGRAKGSGGGGRESLRRGGRITRGVEPPRSVGLPIDLGHLGRVPGLGVGMSGAAAAAGRATRGGGIGRARASLGTTGEVAEGAGKGGDRKAARGLLPDAVARQDEPHEQGQRSCQFLLEHAASSNQICGNGQDR